MRGRAIGTVPPQTKLRRPRAAIELSAPETARDVGTFSAAQHPDAMWRAIGVEPPPADPETDGWARGVLDSLQDDDGAGQAAA